LNGSFTESGLAARFLCVSVPSMKRTFSIDESGIAAAVEADYENSLRLIARKFLAPGLGVPADEMIEMTREALKALCAYAQECEELAHGELQAVAMYVRRWAENAHRIALCLHVSQHGNRAVDHPVSVETMRHAIALQRWFNAHQLRAVRAEWERKQSRRKSKLEELLKSQPEASMTVRDLRRSHGYEEDELERVVSDFPDHFKFETRPSGASGGRPSRILKYTYDHLLPTDGLSCFSRSF